MFVFSSVRHVWAFGLTLPFFVPPWNGHCPDKGFCLYSPLGSYPCHFSSFPWACWPCWSVGLITSFLGLPRPNYLIFTSYSSHGPAGCYSCHVGPLDLLPLFLGFLDPLTSFLLLIPPMGLLPVIPAMLAYWACYLFSWTSSPRLLHLYLLLFPWACWLPFLQCWPIGLVTSFLGLPRPTYFIFTSYSSHGPAGCYSCHVGPLG